jgi:O-Antigen ligase
MCAFRSRPGVSIDRARHLPSRSHAVPILQLFALAVMVIPSDTVITAIGAQGYVAALIGMFAFAAFLAATLLGLHDPLRHRHPIRGVLCVFWLSVLISYVVMDRSTLTMEEAAAVDRMFMQLAVITGVALVAAECLTSLRDVRRVLRALTWGGAFCGVVAALQYWISVDVTPYLRELPGFSLNFENPAIVARGALNRVSGTSITAIELGVVAGMLLPLAIYLAMYDTDRPARKRWAPVALIGLAIPTSVSRSAIISVVLALAVLVVLMPTRQRLVALCAAPLAVTALFMSAPGVIGTLATFFRAGDSDDSVQSRLYDYPVVERLVDQAPWFGHGGGTYMPENPIYILDNQYLKTAIELGTVGVVVLAIFFLVPLISALVARRRSSDPELRLLCAALAGSALAAGACSLTFDSLSFPMFANVYALVIGLIGAGWRLAAAGTASATFPARWGPIPGPPAHHPLPAPE